MVFQGENTAWIKTAVRDIVANGTNYEQSGVSGMESMSVELMRGLRGSFERQPDLGQLMSQAKRCQLDLAGD